MKAEADKQFQEISITNIKSLLKVQIPEKFDKMIISEKQSFKRADFIFKEMVYSKIEREIQSIKFPLYAAVKDNFKEIEGGEIVHGQKKILNSDNIFKILNQQYNINPFKINNIHLEVPLVFPFDEDNNNIQSNQRKYFLPDLTYKEECSTCNANKYITCSDYECNGQHDYTCPTCNGHKKVDCKPCKASGHISCDKCIGRGEYKCSKCSGRGEIKCGSGIFESGCNGSGEITVGDKKQRCKKCSGRGQYPCSECCNGIIKCEKCSSKGELRCNNCSGHGKIDCHKCRAKGNIVCDTCYGDKERYGMIDCSTCMTMGEMAQITYVNTTVSSNNSIISDVFAYRGDFIELDISNVESHIKSNYEFIPIYKKTNETQNENYDQYSLKYASDFEKELNLFKDKFPMIVDEKIFYQIIPCIEVTYLHMLTNTEHSLTIIDFWNNPEIILHKDAEELKQNLGNATKVVGSFFGKLFKSKGFKTKEDKLNEIILLIYLAKVDSKIEEAEKLFLSDMIGNLNEFTNTEKQLLFDFMNTVALPELTLKETTFSSKERADEVIDKLNQLAASDGETEEKEKMLIDKIIQLMKN